MANIVIAKIYSCTGHFFVEYPLSNNTKVSRELIDFRHFNKVNQFHDVNKSAFEGEIYAYFDGINQMAPFDLDNKEGLPDPLNDHKAIEFYPMGSTTSTVPTLITSNKVFAQTLYIAMGADNGAISF